MKAKRWIALLLMLALLTGCTPAAQADGLFGGQQRADAEDGGSFSGWWNSIFNRDKATATPKPTPEPTPTPAPTEEPWNQAPVLQAEAHGVGLVSLVWEYEGAANEFRVFRLEGEEQVYIADATANPLLLREEPAGAQRYQVCAIRRQGGSILQGQLSNVAEVTVPAPATPVPTPIPTPVPTPAPTEAPWRDAPVLQAECQGVGLVSLSWEYEGAANEFRV